MDKRTEFQYQYRELHIRTIKCLLKRLFYNVCSEDIKRHVVKGKLSNNYASRNYFYLRQG